ncbi:MAG: HEAT repeat domain-containing protein [Myxococcaceae bacterium]
MSAAKNHSWDYLSGGFAELLGDLGDSQAVPTLIGLLHPSVCRNIRGAASRALAEIGAAAVPLLHKHFWDADIHLEVIEALGRIGDPASFGLLAQAYDRASSDGDLPLIVLESIGQTPHPQSFDFLHRVVQGKAPESHQEVALQGMALVASQRQAEELRPLLRARLADARSSLSHRLSVLFAALSFRSRFGPDSTSSLRQAVHDFFTEARAAKPRPPGKAHEWTVHRPFATAQEVREYINLRDEVSFVYVPPPEKWDAPSHSYEYHVQPDGSGISLNRYAIEPIADTAAAETLLSEVGLIRDEGMLVVIRGEPGHSWIDPVMLKLGQVGHSHPAPGEESDADRESYRDNEVRLHPVKRALT